MPRGTLLQARALATNPLLVGMEAFWKLADLTDSRGANTLTNNNGATFVAGKLGNAAQFVAASLQSLSIADNPALSTGDIDFTLASWVYGDTVSGTPMIVSKGTLGIGGAEYRLFITGGNFKFQVQDAGGTFKSVTSGVALSAGVWYYVVAWHDAAADTVNIQVNNGTVVSAATAGIVPLDGTNIFYVGRDPNGNYLDGRLDGLFFSKRIYSAAERSYLYNNGNGVDYPFVPRFPLVQARGALVQARVVVT